MNYPIKQKASGILYREIDNPGRGDCGFYAFAIGFINIIQNEIIKGNTNPKQLLILNQYESKKYTADEFMKFDFNQQNKSDRQLLDKMQVGLRRMIYQKYLDDLHHNAVTIEGTNSLKNNDIYMFFLQIVEFFYSDLRFDSAMNFLCLSQEMRDFTEDLADEINDDSEFESKIHNAFLRDLYGKNYQTKVELAWNEDFADSGLSAEEIEILVQFKQFSMVVYDYYDNSCSTRQTNPNFKLKTQAAACGLKLQNPHQRVIITAGDEPMAQENLQQGTLYIQIVSEYPCVVRVNSSILDKAYNYSDAKAEDFLWRIENEFPEWDFEGKITIDGFNEQLLRRFSSTANDILKQNLFPLAIKRAFFQSCPLMKDQNFESISELLESEYVMPIDFQTKDIYREPIAKKLGLEVKESSIVLKAMSNIKTSAWLATHTDLKYLAELTGVHLKALKDGEQTADKSQINDEHKPVITINNVGKAHWTTQIQVAYFGGENATKYASWGYENLPLTKAEIKKILITYTTGFISFFGRNHQKKAEQLIAQCDSNKVSITDIMDDFRNYMSKQNYDPKSSFLKRFEYLDARCRSLENDSFSKKDIEKVFAHYVLTGYFRNHLPEAKRIVAACNNPQMSIDGIINIIDSYVRKNKFNFNADSHFLRCYEQVLEMREAYAEGKQLRII